MVNPAPQPTQRKPRGDGQRSRRTILDAAAKLATVKGLEGLSIGQLAEHIGMSKSGLYAHFRSKEELQLATISTASEMFSAEVSPQRSRQQHRSPELELVCELFLSSLARRSFSARCFSASPPPSSTHIPAPSESRSQNSSEDG